MLPEDGFRIRQHVRQVIHQGCQEAGLNQANIVGIHLVSAKTGSGIDGLITDLSNNWGRRGDMYLLGSTNVGKSTLFNQLMELLCGLPVGHTLGATISRWPGTTLGLISFPIASQSKRERMKRKAYQQETKMIGSLFLDDHDNEQEHPKIKQFDSFAREELSKRRQNQVHDTPGAVNPLQLINHLTQEELGYVTKARNLKPSTVILKPNQCLLIGGIAKLDYTKVS
jgi:ribosome biogenesis GTPase A